ncbi:hypothetical protein [Endozoicomonas numazuensis]|uniref:Uncharacterized protein n=1 Tax=Endozoicomonas numazuensis TaxID=1137799 RepID=A0A081NEN0_9GAMM|nr:hypothetical protein [Endozoicomonas numazuensis]KEQ16903.1 hypothetical protein GZ78_19845 [Endozoicomonas numazuensis]
MDDLIAHYTDTDEDLRLIRQNIARMEFDTTIHLMEKYIPQGTQITEVGAATGSFGEVTYQHWLEHHFSVCREPSLLGSSNHGLVIAKKN